MIPISLLIPISDFPMEQTTIPIHPSSQFPNFLLFVPIPSTSQFLYPAVPFRRPQGSVFVMLPLHPAAGKPIPRQRISYFQPIFCASIPVPDTNFLFPAVRSVLDAVSRKGTPCLRHSRIGVSQESTGPRNLAPPPAGCSPNLKRIKPLRCFIDGVFLGKSGARPIIVVILFMLRSFAVEVIRDALHMWGF